MKIQILGSGCPACKTLYEKTQKVIKKLGLKTQVEYSTDVTEIVKLGVMSSPVFAIDGQVLTAGQAPSSGEIEEMILAWQSDNPLKKDPKDKKGGCSCGGIC